MFSTFLSKFYQSFSIAKSIGITDVTTIHLNGLDITFCFAFSESNSLLTS